MLIASPFAVYTVHALNLLTDATNKSFATQYDLTTYAYEYMYSEPFAHGWLLSFKCTFLLLLLLFVLI